jgi:hypothetical protein
MRILLILIRDQLLGTKTSSNLDFPYAQEFPVGGFPSAMFVRANEMFDSVAKTKTQV